MIKQILVFRSDLRNKHGQKIHTGKLIAQGTHAAKKFLIDRIKAYDGRIIDIFLMKNVFSEAEMEWMLGIFTAVCLKVNSEQELLDIHNKALEAGLVSNLIQDSGLTEFDVPTFTCCGIGPCDTLLTDPITGHLSLF